MFMLREFFKKGDKSKEETIYPLSLFMKLGLDAFSHFNGNQIMKIYEMFCNKYGSVWFSTNAISSGMSEEKIDQFLMAIKNKQQVEIVFVVGKNSGGDNEIKYKANVIDIKTDSNGMISPGEELTPDEWKKAKRKIWIRINTLLPFIGETTKNFIVESTGKELSDEIAKSYYHFGYIRKKG